MNQKKSQSEIKKKLIQDLASKPKKPNSGWIIFFDHPESNERYYFLKMYNIGRVRFSKSKFAMFDSILDTYDALNKIEPALKLYGSPVVKNSNKIKLMAAQATIE
jgi:hypothetical protein